MSDKNVSNVNNSNTNNAQAVLSPASVRVNNNSKNYSIDDIIDHMTADLQSYDGQYIVLGSPHNNSQHIWSEYNNNNNSNSNNNHLSSVTASNTVINNGTQPGTVTQVQLSQVVSNHPIFLQQSPPPAAYELHDRNVDYQSQQCSGLFYTNPAARIQDGTAGGEMIGMVDVGGGNFVNVVFNTTDNPHPPQIHPQYGAASASTTNIPPQHQTTIPTTADNNNISYIYQHPPSVNNSNQIRDYGLFNKDTSTSNPSIQPNRQLIENLVGNWLPNQSGTYSPFGGTSGRSSHNVDNGIDNVGIRLNNAGSNVTTSGVVSSNNSNRKPRAVAEVRPMRLTYSDVLTKSPPPISNNNSSSKATSTPSSNSTTQSGNSTPKSESRKHNNKTNKSGGNKDSASNTKNNASSLRRQHSGGSDDNSSTGSRLISNIHKWMSIEELTPPQSSSEQTCYDHQLLVDDNASGLNYDNDIVNNKRSDKKQKKKSTKQKVNDEKVETLNNEKVGGTSFINNNINNNNNNNNNNTNNNSSGKRTLQINNNLLRSRSNTEKNISKQMKKGGNKDDSKIGLGSMSSSKRSQRSGKRRNCQNYIGMLWNKWQHYALLFATWFFNLLWDVLALSSRLLIHMAAVSFEYTLSMMHCSKLYIYSIFGNKNNYSSNTNNRFKGNSDHHGTGSSKRSWWKFWDRNKKPTRPERLHTTGGLTNNMAIPTTGDEAIRRLLSCKGKDPYSILGVTRHCSDDDIKKYYKRQAVLVHPDKNSQPGAEEAFKILVHAFELIGEPIEGDQVIDGNFFVNRNVSIKGDLITNDTVNDILIQDVAILGGNNTFSGPLEFDCVYSNSDLEIDLNILSGIDVKDWENRAVLIDNNQIISGSWIVDGNISFSSINGEDFNKLNVFQLDNEFERWKAEQMKLQTTIMMNYINECKEIHNRTEIARTQLYELQNFAISQELLFNSDVESIHVIKVQEEDCLVISISKTCTLLMYKWKKENGLFELLFEQNRINGVRKIKAINHQNKTLLITKSASNVNLYNCGSDTDNILWKYSEGDTQLQFVQKLTNLGELLDDNDNEYYNGTFYFVNGNCICKWSTSGNNINYKAGLCREDNLGVTSSQKLIANINNNNQNFKLLINSTDNDTRITEYSLHPSRNYLAIAEIDYPKLQSTTDSIKIYKLDGKLQNKILTLKPHALNWLDIPGQYWISFIENRTTLQVYQQKDENIEFLNILSYRMPSENLITVTLPYQSKLNQIPLMILHGANIVRVIKGNMAGDPYNGISPDCNI